MATDWEIGLEAFHQGRLREAVDRLRAAASDEEHTVSQSVRFQTLTFLGAALYALGQPAPAVSAFESAVTLAPSSNPPTELTINLANAYLACGRRDDAMQALRQTLASAPGHTEALMMLQRLEHRAPDDPVTGTTLGETPESVKKYLRTLTFSRVSAGGYDPAQVRQALTQIEHYVNFLTSQLATREETIARHEAELERYRHMEDSLVENMIQAQQEAERLRQEAQYPSAGMSASPSETSNSSQLSPLEILFQKKPEPSG